MNRITIFLALLLFSSPVQAQIVGNTRAYTLGDAEFEGYVARNPKGRPSRGTVVIVHDWNGLDDYEIRRADTDHRNYRPGHPISPPAPPQSPRQAPP